MVVFNNIIKLGELGCGCLSDIGKSLVFYYKVLLSFRHAKVQLQLVLKQTHYLGGCSLGVIVVAASFIGMVVSVQGFNTLAKFGAEAQLSQLLALSVFRELGPVMTALLYAGRAGSALAADIGLMQVTEQIPAMEVMAINPLNRVILPRWIAGFISLPLLTIIFNAVALVGGFLISIMWLHIDSGVFWSNMQSNVEFNTDVVYGIYKSIVFSLVINWMALYQGYTAVPNASGVGMATTKTVVISSLLVLLLDFIMTAIMFGGL